MQTAFNEMHTVMVDDAVAAYPDHNKWFDVYTAASGYQLGACILHEGQPVAYLPVSCQSHSKII